MYGDTMIRKSKNSLPFVAYISLGTWTIYNSIYSAKLDLQLPLRKVRDMMLTSSIGDDHYILSKSHYIIHRDKLYLTLGDDVTEI
jgi:hypothetical protein